MDMASAIIEAMLGTWFAFMIAKLGRWLDSRKKQQREREEDS